MSGEALQLVHTKDENKSEMTNFYMIACSNWISSLVEDTLTFFRLDRGTDQTDSRHATQTHFVAPCI